MGRTYVYRFLRSSWGIYIELTAEAIPIACHDGAAYEAAPGLWLALPATLRIQPEERHYLLVGLRLVARQLEDTIRRDGPIAVRVVGVEFNPCDYQEEGMAHAIAGWAAEEFGFRFHAPPIEWDRAAWRYRFAFPDEVPVPPQP